MPRKVNINVDIDEMLLEELFDEFGIMDVNTIFGELAENYLAEKHSQNQALIDLGNNQRGRADSGNRRMPQSNRSTGNNVNTTRNTNEHPIHAYQRRLNDEEEHKRRALRGGNIGQTRPGAQNNKPRGFNNNNKNFGNKYDK